MKIISVYKKFMSKHKIPALLMIMGLLGCLIMGCGDKGSANGEIKSDTAQQVVSEPIDENESNETELYSDKPVSFSIPSKISDIYKVTIDGCSYSLPCTVDEFISNGWELNEEYKNMVIDEVGEDSLIVSKKVDGEYIQLLLGVYSLRSGTSIEKLNVGKVSVNDGQEIDMKVSGITIGSSYDEVKESFETKATDLNEMPDTNGRICVKFHFTKDGEVELVKGFSEYIEFVIDPDTKSVFQIIMQFYPAG